MLLKVILVLEQQIVFLDLNNSKSMTEMIEKDVYNIRLKHSLFYFLFAYEKVFNKEKLVNNLSPRIKLSSSEEFCRYD